MKSKRYYFTISLIVLAIALSACGGTAPTEAAAPKTEAAPEPSPVPTPTALPEPISQWAASARSDGESVNVDPNWGHATLAVGEPEVKFCLNQINEGWTVGEEQGEATLEVFFEEAVIPAEINIFESYGPNTIVKVEVLDTEGNYHDIPDLEEPKTVMTCPYTLNVPVGDADYEAMGVRITAQPDYRTLQIDAVELIGLPTGKMTDLPKSQALFEPPPIGERATYDRPDDFPDEYQVHVLYLLASDNVDRERDINGQLAKSFKLANEWLEEQTGGQKFLFDTYQGELDITFIRLPHTESELNTAALDKYDHMDWFPSYISEDYPELQELVDPKPGKLYIAIAEFETPHPWWGVSTGTGFMFALPRLVRNQGPASKDHAYGFEFVILHEVIHEIGFVAECAANHHEKSPMHTTDDNQDLMWAPDDPYAEFYYDVDHYVLDYGNDDYFDHGIPDCPDLADSPFLTPTSEEPYLPDWLHHLRITE